ncbi:FAD/NAD-P-binding domain-containing protein [Trametes meyenii]|nr:FAD/NAD-P-binding domain-containing protein [Trametes meyenii]
MALDSQSIASSWLAALALASHSGDAEAFSALFLPEGWFRDLLALSWDIHSFEGREDIKNYLSTTLTSAQITGLKIEETPYFSPVSSFVPQLHAIDVELAFIFECHNGHGRGYARLLPDKDGSFRALTVMTMLSDLRGHEELDILPLRDDTALPDGRDSQQDFADYVAEVEANPHVLIVGGAQTGLQVAARFKAMQIPTLVIEQHPRVGDVWRKRYPTLTLHTIKRQHSLLYQPFPSNWPEFTPRDKLADWLEHYASIQDLVVWTESKLQPHPIYDPTSGTWDVTILRNGRPVKLRPAHIVLATGTLGKPNIPSFPGQDIFLGQTLHSEGYPGGKRFAGRRVVVVGAGNSSIDICQDLVFNGAQSVTMIQRSATCVSARSVANSHIRARYPDEWPVDVADFKAAAWPFGLQKKLAIATQDARWAAEKELFDKLRKGGLQLTQGPDGEGLYILVLERLGGYWQDKGGADMIADGRIKVVSGMQPVRFTNSSLVLSDDSELPADVVVFATGYVNIREADRELLGDDVVSQIGDVYGLDDEGEVKGSYRPSGHPGVWYATGDFFFSRFHSKTLALQIKAKQLGLY